VANQIAVLMARIARLDCPENWPNLLPVLSEGVQIHSDFTRKCYLNVLRHVIKSLTSCSGILTFRQPWSSTPKEMLNQQSTHSVWPASV